MRHWVFPCVSPIYWPEFVSANFLFVRRGFDICLGLLTKTAVQHFSYSWVAFKNFVKCGKIVLLLVAASIALSLKRSILGTTTSDVQTELFAFIWKEAARMYNQWLFCLSLVFKRKPAFLCQTASLNTVESQCKLCPSFGQNRCFLVQTQWPTSLAKLNPSFFYTEKVVSTIYKQKWHPSSNQILSVLVHSHTDWTEWQL